MVEVLSPRTEREDRGRKKFDYFATPSSLAIIEQDERRIELYTRAGSKSTNEVIEGYGALKLSSIGIEVSLDAIYDDIDSILFGSEGATGKLGLRKGPVML